MQHSYSSKSYRVINANQKVSEANWSNDHGRSLLHEDRVINRELINLDLVNSELINGGTEKWCDIDHYYLDQESQITVYTGDFNDTSNDDIHLLSESEQKRAIKLANSTRSRFITSRVFLRRAIGHACGSAPYMGEFFIDKFGKPHLSSSCTELSFNLSHSGNQLAVAINRSGAVGVDIEVCKRTIPPNLLDYVFTPSEIDRILIQDNWQSAFLCGWTQKEAILKCMGCGFSCEPKKICVPLNNSAPQSLKAYQLSVDDKVIACYNLISIKHLRDSVGFVAVQEKNIILESKV